MPRNAAPPDPERQLMIKTKACQRIAKEVNYYKKEVKENENKLAAMKEAQRDPHDIKKFEEVLGESYMMVPDSEKRLQKGLEDLSELLDSDECKALDSNEWATSAREILKEHGAAGKGDGAGVQETDVSDLKDDEAF